MQITYLVEIFCMEYTALLRLKYGCLIHIYNVFLVKDSDYLRSGNEIFLTGSFI
jgi:hypothetical protein